MGGDKSLSISSRWVVLNCLDLGLLLSLNQSEASLNCGRLIFSDSAKQDLRYACISIEIPFPSFRHKWNRERPILCADEQERGSIRFPHQAMHFIIFMRKLLPPTLVCHGIIG
jgi:hypothetical protein